MPNSILNRRVFLLSASAAVCAGLPMQADAKWGDLPKGKIPPIKKIPPEQRSKYSWIYELPTKADWKAFFDWADKAPPAMAEYTLRKLLPEMNAVDSKLRDVVNDPNAPPGAVAAAKYQRALLVWARKEVTRRLGDLKKKLSTPPTAEEKKKYRAIVKGSPYVPSSVKKLL